MGPVLHSFNETLDLPWWLSCQVESRRTPIGTPSLDLGISWDTQPGKEVEEEGSAEHDQLIMHLLLSPSRPGRIFDPVPVFMILMVFTMEDR